MTVNGNIFEGTIINLKDVMLGNLLLRDVRASVVCNQYAPLLLGQSVLSKTRENRNRQQLKSAVHYLQKNSEIRKDRAQNIPSVFRNIWMV